MRNKIVEYLSDKYRLGGDMTYVIANATGLHGQTSAVRRELEKMERQGLVERSPDNIYARQIKWRMVRAAQAAKQGEK